MFREPGAGGAAAAMAQNAPLRMQQATPTVYGCLSCPAASQLPRMPKRIRLLYGLADDGNERMQVGTLP